MKIAVTAGTATTDAIETVERQAKGISKFKAVCAFLKNGTCSKTLMSLIDRQYGRVLPLEERACDPMAGGLMQGYQCGMLWGATLAAGAQAHHLHGAGTQAEEAALRAAQRLVAAFRARHGHIDCLELTETDPRDKWATFIHFFVKGGTVTCARRIANTADEAYREIETALSEPSVGSGCTEAGCDPASCASKLAQRMGATDRQATLAAGFAGGIGLSGGACGALGAAIWLLGVQAAERGEKGKAVQARIEQTIERFLEASGYEYECREIVGRTFADPADHAAHVRAGGCAELIEAIATA